MVGVQVKILILGAANDQVKLIRVAKQLGYFVIVCDFTSTNPGLSLVDKHYQIDYLDKDKVLAVAIKEKIDGVISNSEPAMPIVAYVAGQLGLQGNKEDSIKVLADKTRFRAIQKELGFFTPKHYVVDSYVGAMSKMQEMRLPVLIKACECSATRGTYKIERFDKEEIRSAYTTSVAHSWNGKVAIEEFVPMPSLTTYEGDIFVFEDDIIWDGIFYTQRSTDAPMVPMTYSGPIAFSDTHIALIKHTLSKIFHAVGIRHGQYNVELYFTPENELFVIEINTRQGGRNLPEFIKEFSGVDLTKLLVSTSVNERKFFLEYKSQIHARRYITHHLIFPHSEGVFAGLYIDVEIEHYLFAKELYINYGGNLHKTYDGTGVIGYVDFEFPDQATRDKYAFHMEKYVYIKYI